MMIVRRVLLGLLGALMLTGAFSCTGPTPPEAPAVAVKKVTPTHQRPKVSGKGKVTMKPAIIDPAVPAELIAKMRNSVATTHGKNSEDLELVRAEKVTWRDGSLGCPEAGLMYTQALVNGYWVVLRSGQEEFDFHASDQGHFSRCQNANKQAPIRHEDI